MKPSNYFIIAAMSSGYLGSFLTGLMGTWIWWTGMTWAMSMFVVIMAVIGLPQSKDRVARAMVASWFMACALGTMSHVSITWSMVMFLPVLAIMAAWAWYIRRGIKKTLISH